MTAITIARGDDHTVRHRVRDASGTPPTIDGARFVAFTGDTIALDYDTAAGIVIEPVADGDATVLTITLTRADTALLDRDVYRYEVKAVVGGAVKQTARDWLRVQPSTIGIDVPGATALLATTEATVVEGSVA